MFINQKAFRYLLSLGINLLLAYPFIKFLVLPAGVSGEFIQNVPYLIFVRMASLSFVINCSNLKIGQTEHRSKGQIIKQIEGWLMWLLFLYFIYHNTGLIFLPYLLGGAVVDSLLILNKPLKQMSEKVMTIAYRAVLLWLLFIVSWIIAAIIDTHYAHIITTKSSLASAESIQLVIASVVVTVLYYMFEPFAKEIFECMFDRKSRLNRFLHRKV